MDNIDTLKQHYYDLLQRNGTFALIDEIKCDNELILELKKNLDIFFKNPDVRLLKCFICQESNEISTEKKIAVAHKFKNLFGKEIRRNIHGFVIYCLPLWSEPMS